MVLYLPVLAWAAPEVLPLQDLVRKSFAYNGNGPGFYMRSKGGNHVEVCGDSCAYFEWKGNVNDERFWRFIVLYELNDAPGTDVRAFSTNVRAMASHELVDSKFCSKAGTDISKVNCDWKSYSKSLGIVVGHSKYDEGLRCHAKGMERELAEQQKLKWKCSPTNPEESPFK